MITLKVDNVPKTWFHKDSFARAHSYEYELPGEFYTNTISIKASFYTLRDSIEFLISLDNESFA